MARMAGKRYHLLLAHVHPELRRQLVHDGLEAQQVRGLHAVHARYLRRHRFEPRQLLAEHIVVGGDDVIDEHVERLTAPVPFVAGRAGRRGLNLADQRLERDATVPARCCQRRLPPAAEIDLVALEHAHARRKCGGNLSDRGLFGNRHARASLPRSPRRPAPRTRRCHGQSIAPRQPGVFARAQTTPGGRGGARWRFCLVRGTSRTRATRHAGVVGRFPGWAALPGRDQALAGIL